MDTKHGEIEASVRTKQSGGHLDRVVDLNANHGRTGDDMLVGQDEAGGVDEKAASLAFPAQDREDAVPELLVHLGFLGNLPRSEGRGPIGQDQDHQRKPTNRTKNRLRFHPVETLHSGCGQPGT